jgi:hypothetical protein
MELYSTMEPIVKVLLESRGKDGCEDLCNRRKHLPLPCNQSILHKVCKDMPVYLSFQDVFNEWTF